MYDVCRIVVTSTAAFKPVMSAAQLLLAVSRTVRPKCITSIPSSAHSQGNLTQIICLSLRAMQVIDNVEVLASSQALDAQVTLLTAVSEVYCLPWHGASEPFQACYVTRFHH